MSSPTFSSELPDAQIGRPYQIIRPKLSRPEKMLLFHGFGMVGKVHWNGERSVVCTRDPRCESCHLFGPARVESWHYVLTEYGRIQVLALPRNATEQLKAMEVARGSLRNVVIVVERKKSRMGPVEIRFSSVNDDNWAEKLPDVFPLGDVLLKLFS